MPYRQVNVPACRWNPVAMVDQERNQDCQRCVPGYCQQEPTIRNRSRKCNSSDFEFFIDHARYDGGRNLAGTLRSGRV